MFTLLYCPLVAAILSAAEETLKSVDFPSVQILGYKKCVLLKCTHFFLKLVIIVSIVEWRIFFSFGHVSFFALVSRFQAAVVYASCVTFTWHLLFEATVKLPSIYFLYCIYQQQMCFITWLQVPKLGWEVFNLRFRCFVKNLQSRISKPEEVFLYVQTNQLNNWVGDMKHCWRWLPVHHHFISSAVDPFSSWTGLNYELHAKF